MSEAEAIPEMPLLDEFKYLFEDLNNSNYGDLSAKDVLVGLLDHGLFAEKVPPCFTSKGLAAAAEALLSDVFEENDENELKKKIDKTAHDFIRYEALRDINIPRHLGVPHPESYAAQALAISKHWTQIRQHCDKPKPPVSRVHVRHVGGGCIFEMNYKGGDRYQLEEDEIQWMAGAQFVVKADIASCFPSVYTHSIPWALHGQEVAKKTTGLTKLSGNLLDKCTQNIRDKQTNGLLIGPHASNIISEIVLTSIDMVLLSKGYKKFKRHINDYEFYANTYAEAEKFLRDLGLSLRTYEMSLNEKKTRILALPRPSTENWRQELNRFVFPKDDEIRFSTVRSFLDLALENAQASGTSAPLNYAIKVLADNRNERPLNARAKRLYVQESMNLALAYPYLVPVLDKFVFDKYSYEGITKKIAEFSASLVILGVQKLYPDTIAHAFYYALKHEFAIPLIQGDLLEVLKLDDCLTNVLFLAYAVKHDLKLAQKKIRKRANEILKSQDFRDKDKHWLLIYQTWTESQLIGNGQAFLANLKKQGFQFLVFPVHEAMKPLAECVILPDQDQQFHVLASPQ